MRFGLRKQPLGETSNDNLTQFAASEGIWVSGESRRARASRIVVDHCANGVRSAAAWTRINTLHADASQGWTTLGADKAFRPTVWRRTDMPRETRADANTVYFPLLAVGSTRIWITRVEVFNNR